MSAASGYALVTGASRGIGAAFAQALAADGHNLILTARHAADLERVRARIVRPGIEVQCLTADLDRSDGAAGLLAAITARGWTVDLLINNAGLGSGGRFDTLPLARELEEVRVNIAALIELTHGCLAGMRERGSGAVIQVASVAGFQPLPFMATYSASKAFVLHFSLALYAEMRPLGIHVMALCPGTTETGFFEVAGIRPATGPGNTMASPEVVVQAALRGLHRRRAVVVCGGANRVMVAAERLLPRPLLARIVARVMKSWRST